jgi:hypothetical protein
MPLTGTDLRIAALSVALSLGGMPVVSKGESWAGGGWRPLEQSGFEGGYADPRDGAPVWDWSKPDGRDVVYPPDPGPSWGDADAGFPGALGAEPAGRGGGDPHTPGPSGGGRSGRPFTAEADWLPGQEGSRWGSAGQGSSADRRDRKGDPARSYGPSETQDPRAARMGPTPAYRSGGPYQEAYSGYRFRGDPPMFGGPSPRTPEGGVYRFRPLTEQERGRYAQGPEVAPTPDWGRTVAPPMNGEPWLDPEAAYGFEPNPWRAR